MTLVMVMKIVTMQISHTDGQKAIESAIECIEQKEATPKILLSLKKLRNIAAEKRQSNVNKK